MTGYMLVALGILIVVIGMQTDTTGGEIGGSLVGLPIVFCGAIGVVKSFLEL